ncbi:c-type cytochrome [Rhodoferax sp. BAB1]|uniref:c-type cytochrome n=1 Tax=Rhodoferax sp. BAB1 TaxID=2741720 RepID=UPI0015770542|nr:c-type cytochrome [Rhodoferax sp. BAB1]QKO23019.1 c-type cytochrome [Rhodoferax sp. BAB1]
MACHGPQGNSQNPQIPSLAGQPKIFVENQLVLIREGLRDIPPMKGTLDGLSDADLIVLAQYFTAQTPVPVLAGPVDTARYERGRALAASMLCGSCHLPTYRGREQIPRLAGQHESFLRTVMQEYRDKPGPGRDTVMTNALLGVKNDQLDDLAHFLAHFK